MNNFKIDFIGVGPPKAGTTWIAKCLKEHPEICLSKPKEVFFFNKKYNFFHKEKSWNYLKGIEWYRKHFEHCEGEDCKIKGEMSTLYFHDLEVPKLIYENFLDTKIIVCLRNPVERAYSDYFHGQFRKFKKRAKFPPFEKIIKNEREFVEIGFYDKHIKKFLEYFPRNQILVLFFDDLKKDPESFIKNVFRFLEVDENFKPSVLKEKINPTAQKTHILHYLYTRFDFYIRRIFIKKIFFKIFGKNITKKIFKIIITPFEKLILLISSKKKLPKMEDKTKKYLKNIYRPHIEELEKMINIDLSNWK